MTTAGDRPAPPPRRLTSPGLGGQQSVNAELERRGRGRRRGGLGEGRGMARAEGGLRQHDAGGGPGHGRRRQKGCPHALLPIEHTQQAAKGG